MKKHTFLLVFILMLTLVVVAPITAAPPAQEPELPPAPISNDEGGPKRLVGSLDYTDFSVPLALEDPAPALLDMANIVQEGPHPTQFAPVESQILGYLTTPVVPPPLRYVVKLPAEPDATLLDVDNDGQEDSGVQIYRMVMGANINGGSYLEQLDQAGDMYSYLTDPVSGQITEGSLLIYAPDDQQGFPGGFGPDGVLFTQDDPGVTVPQGYTVVHFGPAGFSFDRSAEAELNVLESVEAGSPDFSEQGIVESFNSLIDHLAERYSFTDLRSLDWEAIRAEYLPQVEQAEQIAADNLDLGVAIYANSLHRLAQSIRDAHVSSVFTEAVVPQALTLANILQVQPIATNVGVNTVELDDGRIIVTDVISGSPAAEAGWSFGTEIVAVDGGAVAERIPNVIYNEHTGTDEGQRLFQVKNLLKFPAGEGDAPHPEVTIDAILPGESDVQSFTLTPGPYPLPDRLARVPQPMPIQYRMTPPLPNSTWGYLTWTGFEEPEIRMAVLEKFLKEVKSAPLLNGIILDLRGNGGGWDLLYYSMASYFFNADNPVSMHWIDQDSYDPAAGDLVREVAPEYLLSAPQADLYYDGPIVVLVDQNCASSCEFFSQFLQTNGRATVVGQHASSGAGAPINRVSMPYGLTFQYTKGRAYFASTDEMNLEGKGVVPDVRVPVMLETEQAIIEGEDPVLEEGVRVLNDLAGQAMADSLNLVPLPDEVTTAFTALYPEGWAAANQGPATIISSADGLYNLIYNQAAGAVDITAILAGLGLTGTEMVELEPRSANGLEWSIYAFQDAAGFVYHYALAQANDMTYIVAIATPGDTADVLREGLLNPAIDAFVPGEGN